MLYLSEDDVRRLLPMKETIRLMRDVFLSLAQGGAQNQPRRRMSLPSGTVLHSMAGAWGGYLGTKVYSTHPQHGAYFFFLLYDAGAARPLAMLEANWLGQIRTGAASGLATDLLARPDADTVGMIGSGFQARSQLEAVLQVRQARQVRVFSRKPDRCRQFADECSAGLGAPVMPVDSAQEAVAGAGIVVTATNAKHPVVESHWVEPGAHINAAGSNRADRRELTAELVHRADLIAVDSIEQANIESGDLILAFEPEHWQEGRIVEMSQVVAGKAGRRRPDDITIFKSNGLGVEDVAAGAFVYERASKDKVGKEL